MNAFIFNPNFWTRKRLFWLLHILGWIFITTWLYALYGKGLTSNAHHIRFISYYILGFLVTLLLRKTLRNIANKNLHILGLLFRLIILTLVSTLVIYLGHFAISLPTFRGEIPLDEYYQEIISSLFWRYLFVPHTLIIFMIVFLWQILYLGLKFLWDRSAERDAAKEAMSMAQKAQFEMLRYQLNPHFLFNSLNSIWALAEDDPKTTKNMITELSEFLRYSLQSNVQNYYPLEHELDALNNYFSIEKKRFQDNLIVDFDIDPKTKEIPVIGFLIQPFVENAIKFGMKTSPMPLKITISTKSVSNTLRISIFNTGKWIHPNNSFNDIDHSVGTGIGLKNAIKRLELVYPEQHLFYIEKQPSYVRVNIEIYRYHDKKL